MTEPKEGQAPAAGAQQIQVQVRDEKAHTMYTNMWTVRPTHSAEEIIIDFGMAIPSAERQDAMILDVQSRVILNYFSAKRLALQLSQVVQRYEQQFGTVELDVRKRLKQG